MEVIGGSELVGRELVVSIMLVGEVISRSMNEKSSYLPSKSPPEDKDQGKRTLVSQSNIHRHEKIS